MIIVNITLGLAAMALAVLVIVVSLEMLNIFKWGWKYYNIFEKCGVIIQMAFMATVLVMLGVCIVAAVTLLL